MNAWVIPPARTTCHIRAIARAATSPEYKKIALTNPQERKKMARWNAVGRAVAPPYRNASGTVKKPPSEANSWVVAMARTMTLSPIGLRFRSPIVIRLRTGAAPHLLEAHAALRRQGLSFEWLVAPSSIVPRILL